ncbi:hypothetical protein HZH68_002253 [Vespula germanica]|uniref:Uncharacterized protein n=1 Tax=Vespula germanica TaxID=30212 RepID=A0A834NM33_VESGE|nr:hypothetical protein HZH68_002253 [Vespula germanica]
METRCGHNATITRQFVRAVASNKPSSWDKGGSVDSDAKAFRGVGKAKRVLELELVTNEQNPLLESGHWTLTVRIVSTMFVSSRIVLLISSTIKAAKEADRLANRKAIAWNRVLKCHQCWMRTLMDDRRRRNSHFVRGQTWQHMITYW